MDEATEAILSAATEIYESRAAYAVVGVLGLAEDPDWRDSRVVLGPFSTPATAQAAKESLYYSGQTNETFHTFVFPMWHGSPASFFTSRKLDKKRLEQMDAGPRAAAERAMQRRVDWFARNPDMVGGPPDYKMPFPEDIDDEAERCTGCGRKLEEEGDAA